MDFNPRTQSFLALTTHIVNGTVAADDIVEVDLQGRVLWRWDTLRHIPFRAHLLGGWEDEVCVASCRSWDGARGREGGARDREAGGLCPGDRQQRLLAVGQAVVGQVLAVLKRLEGSRVESRWNGTDRRCEGGRGTAFTEGGGPWATAIGRLNERPSDSSRPSTNGDCRLAADRRFLKAGALWNAQCLSLWLGLQGARCGPCSWIRLGGTLRFTRVPGAGEQRVTPPLRFRGGPASTGQDEAVLQWTPPRAPPGAPGGPP